MSMNPEAEEFRPKGESKGNMGKGKGPAPKQANKPTPKPRKNIILAKRMQDAVNKATDEAVKKQVDQLKKIEDAMNNKFKKAHPPTKTPRVGKFNGSTITTFDTKGTNTTKTGGTRTGLRPGKFAKRLGTILGGIGSVLDPIAQIEAEKIKADNKLRLQGNDLQFRSDIETRRYKAALNLNETRQLYSLERMNKAFKHQGALVGIASQENRRNMQFQHDIRANALRQSGLPSALLYTGVSSSNRTSQHLGGRNFREFTPLSGTQFSGTYMQKALGIGEVKNGNFYDGRQDLAVPTKKIYKMPPKPTKKDDSEKFADVWIGA